jgi:predicted  nucleic acid-binding Zn-ribbon protein
LKWPSYANHGFDPYRYEETLNNLSQARVEIEKFRKKAELLTTEYYTLQTDSTKRISELSAKIDELAEKLLGFEGLEAELESAALSGDVSPVLFLP